jgi:hypothetical protein
MEDVLISIQRNGVALKGKLHFKEFQSACDKEI